METGTRALIGAVFGCTADGELTWARRLLHLLDDTMIVLVIAALTPGVPGRGRCHPRPVPGPGHRRAPPAGPAPPARRVVHLPDRRRQGTGYHRAGDGYLPDGTRYGGCYRLATTLLDHRAWPADALIAVYHERWEHEITYLALRHTLLTGRMLRSGDPAGLEQEMWALLALYQALRTAITDAVATAPGTDPDRASYQVAVQTTQILVTSARNIVTEPGDLAGDIGRVVLPACTARAGHGSAPGGSSPRYPAGTSTRPASPPHASSQQDHHYGPPGPAAGTNTPTTVLDTGARPLTPRH